VTLPTGYVPSIKQEDIHKYMMAMDTFVWCQMNRIRLVGSEYKLQGHEYQMDWLKSKARKRCYRKATQMAVTETEVLRALHDMIYQELPKGALFLFPTADEVADFSSTRFNPLLKENQATIGKFVRETDRTNLKRIGSGFLYFRGARMQDEDEGMGTKKKSAKLKSIPVDRLVLDEYDEMPEDARALGIGRMQASEKKEEVYIANPTLPGYGIDKIYEEESDQRVWLLKCMKCGKETCLELEFPNCLERTPGEYSGHGLVVDTNTAGVVKRICIHCRNEIGLRHGRWEPRIPGRDMEGYWISHLSSSTVSATEILNEWEKHDLNLIQFCNLRLGMGYAKIDDQLSKSDVLNCCKRDAMASRHDGPCAMGVDVGKILNVTIGCRPADGRLRVVKAARVSSFNDIQDLAKAFNVRCAVFDIEPETRKVREFQKACGFEVFLCKYKESQAKDMTFDTDSGLCLVNRTEILDATHYLVTVPGRLELPRRDAEMEVFSDQMSAVAKRLEKNEKTGKTAYIYKALRPDHYRHSMNYLYMAASRIGIYKPTEWVKKKTNKGWEQDFNDSDDSGATGWMGL
jgi:hypothetical protein